MIRTQKSKLLFIEPAGGCVSMLAAFYRPTIRKIVSSKRSLCCDGRGRKCVAVWVMVPSRDTEVGGIFYGRLRTTVV